jgi:nitroreductase
MNETIKSILNRRSHRDYKIEQIKKEDLENILKAGKYAPSGMNKQPWHFTVIQDKDMLKRINEACKKDMLKSEIPAMKSWAKDEKFNAFYNAQTLIIVSGDDNVITVQFDCALAIGNMLVAAESLGIGSCWIHTPSMIADKEFLNILGIPDGYKIYGSAIFGYSNKKPEAPIRKEDIVNIVK